MLFSLKKLISQFLFPLPLTLLLLGVTVFFAFRKKTSWIVRLPLVLAFLMLFVASFRITSHLAIQSLETVYPPLGVGEIPFPEDALKCKYIVVLGGGVAPVFNVPPASRLTEMSLGRLVEGVRLANLLPNTRLIFTGGLSEEALPIADAMSMAAGAMGMAPERIIALPSARDTAEEALSVASIVGTRPFILVTSATHLPRAMKLFQALGLRPIAAPSQFISERGPLWTWNNLRWDVQSMERTTGAVYEYLGNMWGFLNGWFATDQNKQKALGPTKPRPQQPSAPHPQQPPAQIQQHIEQGPPPAQPPQQHTLEGEAGVGGEPSAEPHQ